MRYVFIILALICVFMPSPSHAQSRIELRTCKVGNVIYTEDSRGTKCIPPLTPEGIKVLMDVIKATTPPPESEEFKRNKRFCEIYSERNDVPNKLKYCIAASEAGSLAATERMCDQYFQIDSSSNETLKYCSIASDKGSPLGHLYMARSNIYNNDWVAATRYFYRGVERSFFYDLKIAPWNSQRRFGPAQDHLTKFMTERYMVYAGENIYGASLESLGFPKIEIDSEMTLSQKMQRGTIVNDWIGIVDINPLDKVIEPQRVKYTIFTAPLGDSTENIGGRIVQVKDLAQPILCYLKNEDGTILMGGAGADVHKAACGYLAVYGRYRAAVDVNGNYAPSFVRGAAEIRQGEVVLLN